MTQRIEVLTLFPAMLEPFFTGSILGRAQSRGLLELQAVDLREFAEGRHRITDEPPFGGGAGMVLKPEPIFRAVEHLDPRRRATVVLLSPQGTPFRQELARQLAERSHLILIAGHYEGVDERVQALCDLEVSIGDYVLTGGEPAAVVVVDAVARLLPGVLGASASLEEESFTDGVLEAPHYTRPREFRGLVVPEILLSGHHGQIARWRRKMALLRTRERRPDLFEKLPLTALDRTLLAEAEREAAQEPAAEAAQSTEKEE